MLSPSSIKHKNELKMQNCSSANTYKFHILLKTEKGEPAVSSVAKRTLSVREVWGSIPGPVKSDTVSPTTRHRCDVSSELCSPGAKPRRWAPQLVTRFGVIQRV